MTVGLDFQMLMNIRFTGIIDQGECRLDIVVLTVACRMNVYFIRRADDLYIFCKKKSSSLFYIRLVKARRQ